VIFAADAVPLIKDRRKSQTRIPVQDGAISLKVKPCRLQVGSLYKIQAVNFDQDGRREGRPVTTNLAVTVMAVHQERLGDISQQDVRREGFTFKAQFETQWRQLHGDPRPDQLVWVISFAVGDHRDHFDQPRLLAALPGAMRFEPLQPTAEGAKGRWAVTSDPDNEHQDYTTRSRQAMSQEPEGVDARTLDRFALEARARQESQTRRRDTRSIAIRLKDAEKRNDADAIREIRDELERLEQEMRRAA
jgi:hypothetical protein